MLEPRRSLPQPLCRVEKRTGLAVLRMASLERAGAPSLRGIAGGMDLSPSPAAARARGTRERAPYVSSDGGAVPRPRRAILLRHRRAPHGLSHLPQPPFWGSPLGAGAVVSPRGWHNPALAGVGGTGWQIAPSPWFLQSSRLHRHWLRGRQPWGGGTWAQGPF